MSKPSGAHGSSGFPNNRGTDEHHFSSLAKEVELKALESAKSYYRLFFEVVNKGAHGGSEGGPEQGDGDVDESLTDHNEGTSNASPAFLSPEKGEAEQPNEAPYANLSLDARGGGAMEDLLNSSWASSSYGLYADRSLSAFHTPFHTFFPPVARHEDQRRIIEIIVGRKTQPFSAWKWTSSPAFANILRRRHSSSLKSVGDDRVLHGRRSQLYRSDGERGSWEWSAALDSSFDDLTAKNFGGVSPPSSMPHTDPRTIAEQGVRATPCQHSTPPPQPSAGGTAPSHFSCTFPASHQGPEYFSRLAEESNSRVVIAMVGLPARGKTFLAQKIARLLGWHGERATVFNLQAAWRQTLLTRLEAVAPVDRRWVRVEHFTRLIREAKSAEREAYLSVLDECVKSAESFFEEGGRIVVLNDDFVTQELRMEVERRFRDLGSYFFYIEMRRDHARNIRFNEFKVSDPSEYPSGVHREEARCDFEERVRVLESMYESLDDINEEETRKAEENPNYTRQLLSYVTIQDSGTIEVHNVEGFLCSQIVSFLMNISQRKVQHPIYFVRHGESCFNLENRIGGNSLLTAQGMKDAAALLEFLDALQEEQKRKAAPVESSAAGADCQSGCGPSCSAPPCAPASSPNTIEIWTSQMQRAIQTAELSERLLNIKTLRWSSLNELHAGVCEKMTVDEVQEKYELIEKFRQIGRYTFRYPGGESYQDMVMRLEPVIMELENANKVVVVVAHQGVLRCLLSYFGNVSAESSIRISVPHRVVWRCVYDSKGVASLDEIVLDNLNAGTFADKALA